MPIPGDAFAGVVDLPRRELMAGAGSLSDGLPQSFAWIVRLLRGLPDRFWASGTAERDCKRIPFVISGGGFYFLVPSGTPAGGTDILACSGDRASRPAGPHRPISPRRQARDGGGRARVSATREPGAADRTLTR